MQSRVTVITSKLIIVQYYFDSNSPMIAIFHLSMRRCTFYLFMVKIVGSIQNMVIPAITIMVTAIINAFLTSIFIVLS